MEIKFSKAFEKDLKSITNTSLILKVGDILNQLQLSTSLEALKGVKQLKGHKNCYRIRIGDYRLGLVVEGKYVWVSRLMHRKEIYRYFP